MASLRAEAANRKGCWVRPGWVFGGDRGPGRYAGIRAGTARADWPDSAGPAGLAGL